MPIFSHNTLVCTSLGPENIFGDKFLEKYEVDYTAIWSQNNTKMDSFWPLRAFKHCFRLP